MTTFDRYDSLLMWYAEQSHLDWSLLKRQMLAESSANPQAVSPCGAKGLMQFLDMTWAEWAPHDSPFNPEAAIRVGALYMASLLRQFDGDMRKALAAYNWGSGHVRSASARLGDAWETALPAETTAYLAKILSI